MITPPCIRHGEKGIADARLLSALAAFRTGNGIALDDKIEAMTDYDGQLWTTWRDPADRDRFASALSRVWEQVGGERGALHLVRSDEDFDYQEDCMSDPG
jgi:hypothetical protein